MFSRVVLSTESGFAGGTSCDLLRDAPKEIAKLDADAYDYDSDSDLEEEETGGKVSVASPSLETYVLQQPLLSFYPLKPIDMKVGTKNLISGQKSSLLGLYAVELLQSMVPRIKRKSTYSTCLRPKN